jgi:hypothetical protein
MGVPIGRRTDGSVRVSSHVSGLPQLTVKAFLLRTINVVRAAGIANSTGLDCGPDGPDTSYF